MMTVPMDENSPAPEKRERAQRLLKRIVELENGLRKSAQSKVPSDPNAWSEMRDKYEAIILEDHDFSEKHEIEFHLWQLHYRRIEEFRSHINAAASASQRGKNMSKPDQIKKIRGIFKSFLSESTGFYHDLIQKIRSKYGLPLGYFGEGADNQVLSSKDEKRTAEIKKGLLSCHRCLIYLGDLGRYKALYGEGDSVTRDFAAASSYYMQASSLWPGSGNPHHQLAILASYSGDELVAIYRYFRSLLVDSPFTTARDNLIIAFEKNRQSYSQLPNNSSMGPSARSLPTRAAWKDRRRGDNRPPAKDATLESAVLKEQELSVPEIFKAFSTRFVRLNGILFTRTSLETFAEVFSSSICDLRILLTSGSYEELNFGLDADENGLVIVRLIAILIFMVHNVNRESENQSYAEILQRSVLLQNAYTAAFEFAGQILKSCSQLNDAASSYLSPGILVFSEWLACHPDMAAVSDADEKQAAARSFFWNQYVAFINKLISGGLVTFNSNEDDTCFSEMTRYDDEETGNRLALWEDFELRGFSPLVPAHLILDFSRKHPCGSDGSSKEKTARAQRILAAARILMNVVRVDNQGIYFDQNQKKFIISVEPPAYEEPVSVLDVPLSSAIQKESSSRITGDIGAILSKFSAQSKAELPLEGDDEDEEIVFKPNATDKLFISSSNKHDVVQHGQNHLNGEWAAYGGGLSMPLASMQMPISAASSKISTPVIPSMQLLQQMSPSTSHWFTGQDFVSDELNALKIIENGPSVQQGLQEQFKSLNSTAYQNSFSAANNLASSMMMDSRGKLAENFMSYLPGQFPSLAKSDVGAMSIPATSRASPPSSRKNPVSRPVRHVGPPPGFTNVPARQLDGVFSNTAGEESHPQVDDYSWLDGYQSSIVKDSDKEIPSHLANAYSSPNIGNTSALTDAMSFPFPGKQVPVAQAKVQNEKWQDFQLFDQHKMYSDQQFQQAMHKAPTPNQYQAQSLWSGHYYV